MRGLFCKLFLCFLFAGLLVTFASAVLTHWQSISQLQTHPAVNILQSTSVPSLSAGQSLVQLKLKRLNTPETVYLVQFGRSIFSITPVRCLLLLALNGMLAAGLAWQIASPVYRLTMRLREAAEKDLQSLLASGKGKNYAPFSVLAHALDGFALQLNHLMKSQKTMLHHVSHELRSPLARIQMAVGLAQQDVKKADASIQRIALETVRMEKMIADLLAMSRLESGVGQLNKIDFDMKAMLTALVNDVRFESERANIYLSMPDEAVWFFGQVELLQRAIGNVIRNAVKYGPQAGVIGVELKYAQHCPGLVVSVQDAGKGVNPNEMSDIFKPFVRGSGTSQVEGHGIGLAMTKYIVDAHGGDIQAINLNPGFVIRMHLPILMA